MPKNTMRRKACVLETKNVCEATTFAFTLTFNKPSGAVWSFLRENVTGFFIIIIFFYFIGMVQNLIKV